MIITDRREAWRLRAIEYVLARVGCYVDGGGGGDLVWIADSGTDRAVGVNGTQAFTEHFWPIRDRDRSELRREVVRFLG